MKNTEEYVYILDYCNGGLYEIKLEPEDRNRELDMDVFLKEYGLNADECSWMFTTNRIYNIERIEKEYNYE